MASEREAEELLRALMQQQASQRSAESDAHTSSSNQPDTLRRSTIDRSNPIEAQAFGVLDEVQAQTLLSGANRILYNGTGKVLPVQGTAEVEETTYQTGEASNRQNWPDPQRSFTYGEWRGKVTYRFAGYVLVGPSEQDGYRRTIYAGFVGHTNAPSYERFVVETGAATNDYSGMDAITPLGLAGSSQNNYSVSQALSNRSLLPQARSDFAAKLASVVGRYAK